jgi:DNA polymerase III subunit chi
MTRIDFYILPEGSSESAVVTATRLCDKAAAQGCHIYVHVPELSEAEDLDGVLWSLRQGSFLAHERYSGAAVADPVPAILIGTLEPPDSHHQVLINLGNEVPAYFSRFERVCEIVGGDAARRSRSRERYKFYRDRGYELQTHNL